MSSKWYNNKVKSQMFAVGDNVRVYYPRRYPGRSPKWQSLYSTEGVIVKKLNDVTYIVKSKSWKSEKVIHVTN